MKKKVIFYSLSSLFALALVIGVSFGNISRLGFEAKATGRTCASIHFGMDDTTLKAKTYGKGNSTAMGETTLADFTDSISASDGISVTAISGAAYVYKNTANYKLPIRFGKSSKGAGKITLTLNASVTKMVMYACAWSGDTPTVSVNGSSAQTITNEAGSLGDIAAAEAVETQYVPYTFSLSSTNKVNIVGNVASKGRFFIADLAFLVG
jgi:hypothetical protein